MRVKHVPEPGIILGPAFHPVVLESTVPMIHAEKVHEILQHEGIESGRIHNPSARVDPDYWRFFVRAKSQQDFLERVGSWHPRKQAQINARVKI